MTEVCIECGRWMKVMSRGSVNKLDKEMAGKRGFYGS